MLELQLDRSAHRVKVSNRSRLFPGRIYGYKFRWEVEQEEQEEQ